MPSPHPRNPRRACALAAAVLAGACFVCGCEEPRAAPPETTGAERAAGELPPAPAAQPAPRDDASMNDALSDPGITARVKSSLARDPALAGADISVYTDRGAVSLTGRVRSQEQIALAAAHAQAEDGVMRVDEHLMLSTH